MLGHDKGEVNDTTQCAIKENGNVVPRRTLIPPNISEIHSPVDINKFIFYSLI